MLPFLSQVWDIGHILIQLKYHLKTANKKSKREIFKNISLFLIDDDFAQAIRDVLEGKETALSFAEAQQIVNAHFAEMEKKAHAAAIEQGEMFLKMNKERPGVVTLPSGLQYEVIKEGNGKKPSAII